MAIAVERMRSGAAEMRAMVENLLDFSALEAGRLTVAQTLAILSNRNLVTINQDSLALQATTMTRVPDFDLDRRDLAEMQIGAELRAVAGAGLAPALAYIAAWILSTPGLLSPCP